ncbi:MAG: hypothetical protein C4519_18200 [Desulfobacteraceae bacterium]|nr:MAG: hypothetical protein C4519_18200 [Desulfobacteraceae bacterium]
MKPKTAEGIWGAGGNDRSNDRSMEDFQAFSTPAGTGCIAFSSVHQKITSMGAPAAAPATSR